MRNLKKVLSLTLALVMMLGMMTFAGAAETTKLTAADFKDMDKVVNKEAVSLLVDLGVLNGIKAADGTYTFNPAGNIERGAYAKMIYAVMMASNNADVYKGVNTGLTDVKGHWAEGFIGYCVSTKIAAGNGNGTFTPNANISVVAGAKMLLTALGYDAKASGYENDALWSINIMRDAQSAGLMNGVAQAAGDTMTRDTAARLIYNALFAVTVTPKFAYDMGVKYLDEYKPGSVLGVNSFTLAKVVGIVTANEANTGSTLEGKTKISTNGILAGTNIATKTALEDLGKSVTYYTYKMGGKDLVSTVAYPTDKNKVVAIPADLSTTDKQNKWLNTNGLAISNGTDKDATITDYDYTSGSVTNAITTLALSGNNAMIATAIDNNGDGTIDVISKITKALAKVTGDVKTKTATDGTVTVYVPGITGGYEAVVGAKDLAKNDWATWIKIGDVYNITECTTVEGKVTGYKGSDTIYVDGTAYTISSIANAAFDTLGEYKSFGYKDAGKFYLDDNKNLVFAEKTSTTTTYNTAVVLGYDKPASTTASNVGTAKLLFLDGTVENVKVASFKKNSDGKALDGFKNGFGTTDKTVAFGTDFMFAAYSVDKDGQYKLVALDTAKALEDVAYKQVAMSDHGITPGAPKFLFDNTSAVVGDMIGNSETVFLVATWNDAKDAVTGYKVYTGIANAPKYVGKDAVGADGEILTADGVAKIVFVAGGASVSVGKDTKFIYVDTNADPAFNGVNETFTYATGAYMGGVEMKNLISEKALAAGELNQVELNADGVVVSAKTITPDKQGIEYLKGVVAIDTANTATYLTYDADVEVVVIADDGTTTTVSAIDVASIQTDSNDAVYYTTVAGSSTKIDKLFIIKAAVTYAGGITKVQEKLDSAEAADMTAGAVKDLGAGTSLVITATVKKGYTATVTVAGKGTTVVAKSTDAKGGAVAATYTLDTTALTGDTAVANSITVTVVVTDGNNQDIAKYTVDTVA